MTRVIFIILISVSCTGRKHKLDKKNLIPEKELVSILTDIHLADGLLTLPSVNSWASSMDSITSYYQIIEKHGYTKELMDKTMKYYFLDNPKKLNKIYDEVLGILSGMESRVDKEAAMLQQKLANLWRGKEFYAFPSTSGNEYPVFDTTFYRPGFYSLSYSVTLYPDDQSVNPRAFVFTTSADSADTSKGRYYTSAEYVKDGLPHTYTMVFIVPANEIRHVKGCLIGMNTNPSGPQRHILIDNILLIFTLMAV
jgi:hypothetical protein